MAFTQEQYEAFKELDRRGALSPERKQAFTMLSERGAFKQFERTIEQPEVVQTETPAELTPAATQRGVIPIEPGPFLSATEQQRAEAVKTARFATPQTAAPGPQTIADLQAAESLQPGVTPFELTKGAIAEPLATLGSGAVAQVLSGLGSLRTLLQTGDIDKAANVTKQLQDALTVKPETEAGKAVLGAAGKVIKPVAKVAGTIPTFAGGVAEKVGGPVAGALTETAIRMIPEIIGLKGSTAFKRATINKALKGKVSELYDELGNVLPEVKKGLDDAGISIDEINDILPPKQPIETLTETIEKARAATATSIIGETRAAAKAVTGAEKRKITDIAGEVKPSKEILDAAEEFGVADDIIMSVISRNPIFRAIEMGLSSQIGSKIAAKHQASVVKLSKQADDLITEFGGEIDKSLLSDTFKTKSRAVIEELEQEASKLYDSVEQTIPKSSLVDTTNIVKIIEKRIDDLGGAKFLDPKEKMLLSGLKQKTKPTYARLDNFRKQIGGTLSKKSEVFKNSEESFLKQLYGALAKDQQIAAKKHGLDDVYALANASVVKRKGIEKQLIQTLGKDLSGNITSKAKQAILNLQKGETKFFDKLSENIPNDLGPELRKSIFVTSLNDAFTQASRMEKSLNIPGFDDFMNGLNRHKSAKTRLVKEIGPESMKRLETFHTLVGGFRRAGKESVTTGRTLTVPKNLVDEVVNIFDSTDNIGKRLYGTSKKVIAAEGVSTAVGLPGAGTAGVIGSLLSAKKTARSIAADQLLSSAKFQKIVKLKAEGKLNTADKIKQAEKAVQDLKQYKKWSETLPPKDVNDIALLGTIAYLTGEKEGKK